MQAVEWTAGRATGRRSPQGGDGRLELRPGRLAARMRGYDRDDSGDGALGTATWAGCWAGRAIARRPRPSDLWIVPCALAWRPCRRMPGGAACAGSVASGEAKAGAATPVRAGPAGRSPLASRRLILRRRCTPVRAGPAGRPPLLRQRGSAADQGGCAPVRGTQGRGQYALGNVEQEWNKIRGEEGSRHARDIPEINRWYEALGPAHRRTAKSLSGRINRVLVDDGERRLIRPHG